MNKSDIDVELSGKITLADIRGLRAKGPIHELKITKSSTLTVELTRPLPTLQSVEQLWLWCDVTRSAMRNVVRIPGLRVLDILAIKSPGRLEHFADASSLEIFRANHYLSEEDVLEVLNCASLEEVGIQGATLSSRVIAKVLAHPSLSSLDIESTEFDDAMAEAISVSTQIHTLDIGATKITGAGLAYLSGMVQVKALDLWATNITIDDLDMLTGLPHLEYLSLGNFDDIPSFNAAELIQKLEKFPSLKNIWLDGIYLDEQQTTRLRSRFENVRISCI
ncbi:hypothetical protein ACO0K9_15455 [Undibacterium sp. Ji50W]|uniref:hypothetical protein n=1 Tax=Undibacterium sp. Ji50W TaxID=3413041 RepID=UPI003BF11681